MRAGGAAAPCTAATSRSCSRAARTWWCSPTAARASGGRSGRDLPRAPRPLLLLLPGRRLPARGAGRAGGRARVRDGRADRPRRPVRVADLRPRRPRCRHPGRHRRRDHPGRRRAPHPAGRDGRRLPQPVPADHRRSRRRPPRAGGDARPGRPPRRRALLQDALVAIRQNTTLEACEADRRGNHEAVLRAPAETAARFPEEAVRGACAVADRCRFDLTQDLGYSYPDFGDGGEPAGAALARICRDELERRYTGTANLAAARTRLDEELRLIERHGLAGFFLLHRDILEMARDVAERVRGRSAGRHLLPPGRGRGSSVGSIVCYLIGLSHVDPIAARLFLGRFLSEELASVPDIDLDFPRDVREGLMLDVVERYGPEHAALVAAFPTYRVRGAVRDLGKALALPPGEVERMARLADEWGAIGPDQVEQMRERADSPRWRAFAFLMEEIMGLPRHISQHSGGMVISTRPLVELVPVVPAAMEGRQICQWDKDSCADAGFLKIDLLGLGMLSAVEECVDLIAETRGSPIDLSRVGFSDPEVYAEIQEADTVGVFQIESRAQMQSLRQTRPENLDDLTVQVALVRPGPIVGDAVNPYIAHRRAKRHDPDFRPPYDHPLLEPVLADTLGVVVFQDQVLEVAIALAGFSTGEADSLRRAMSRKRSREALEGHWRRFRDGAAANGVDEETARRVFDKVVAFSEFGFPKSHAAAFAILAYQSAWLHRAYPAEFLCSLLNAQPMGFYPPATLLRDGERRGVEMRPPDVNRSGAGCTVEDGGGAVRIGLGYVKGVGTRAEGLVAERAGGGPFFDLGDLVRRAPLDISQLESLVRAGACDEFHPNRRRLLWELPLHRAPSGPEGARQLALALDGSSTPALPGLTAWERMVADHEAMSLTTGPHPMALLREGLDPALRTSADLRTDGLGQTTTAGIVIARQRPGTATGSVFLLLEDEHGMTNVIVPPAVYERDRIMVRAEPLLQVWGRLERRTGAVNVIADRIAGLSHAARPEVARAAARAAGTGAGQGGHVADLRRLRAAAPAANSFGRGRR